MQFCATDKGVSSVCVYGKCWGRC